MEVGSRMCKVNSVGGFQGKDCSLLSELVLFGRTKFKAHPSCLHFKQKQLLSQRCSKTNHHRNMRLFICRINDFKFSWVHMEKVLHRFAGCRVLQNIPFFLWLFLNDTQLKALPLALGSLCSLYGLEQDLSFVLGKSINPASI